MRQALFNNPALTSQMSDTNRFPTTAITGYKGIGLDDTARPTATTSTAPTAR